MNDAEEVDLRGPAVVVRGSVLSGFQFVGPFNTIQDAIEWCETATLEGVLGVKRDVIALLEQPKQ